MTLYGKFLLDTMESSVTLLTLILYSLFFSFFSNFGRVLLPRKVDFKMCRLRLATSALSRFSPTFTGICRFQLSVQPVQKPSSSNSMHGTGQRQAQPTIPVIAHAPSIRKETSPLSLSRTPQLTFLLSLHLSNPPRPITHHSWLPPPPAFPVACRLKVRQLCSARIP